MASFGNINVMLLELRQIGRIEHKREPINRSCAAEIIWRRSRYGEF